MPDQPKPEEHHFFVDAKEYTTDKRALSGLDIKTRAGVTPTYQLYLEEEGETPDRAISNGESVDMRGWSWKIGDSVLSNEGAAEQIITSFVLLIETKQS